MVDGIATGQTFQLDDENALPQPLLDLLEELLHDGPGGDSLAGDDLPVNLGDVVGAAPGDLNKELFVAGQRFALAVGLGLHVGVGLAQVDTVRLHGYHLHGKRPSRGGAEIHIDHIADFSDDPASAPFLS